MQYPTLRMDYDGCARDPTILFELGNSGHVEVARGRATFVTHTRTTDPDAPQHRPVALPYSTGVLADGAIYHCITPANAPAIYWYQFDLDAPHDTNREDGTVFKLTTQGGENIAHFTLPPTQGEAPPPPTGRFSSWLANHAADQESHTQEQLLATWASGERHPADMHAFEQAVIAIRDNMRTPRYWENLDVREQCVRERSRIAANMKNNDNNTDTWRFLKLDQMQ